MVNGLRIHGSLNLRGPDTEIHGLELEEDIVDPALPNKGSVWLNSTLDQVSYADTNNNVRRIASDLDINNLLSINQKYVINDTMTNFVFGQPVYGVTDTFVELANASIPTKQNVIGLIASDNITINSGNGTIQITGNLTGTIDQWNVVTGNTNGLVPLANYFLDINTGRITNIPPMDAALYICPIGRALSETTLNVQIGNIITL